MDVSPGAERLVRERQVAVLRAHLAHRTAEVEEARTQLQVALARVAELEGAVTRGTRWGSLWR